MDEDGELAHVQEQTHYPIYLKTELYHRPKALKNNKVLLYHRRGPSGHVRSHLPTSIGEAGGFITSKCHF